jgi:hypothetical protein
MELLRILPEPEPEPEPDMNLPSGLSSLVALPMCGASLHSQAGFVDLMSQATPSL